MTPRGVGCGLERFESDLCGFGCCTLVVLNTGWMALAVTQDDLAKTWVLFVVTSRVLAVPWVVAAVTWAVLVVAWAILSVTCSTLGGTWVVLGVLVTGSKRNQN